MEESKLVFEGWPCECTKEDWLYEPICHAVIFLSTSVPAVHHQRLSHWARITGGGGKALSRGSKCPVRSKRINSTKPTFSRRMSGHCPRTFIAVDVCPPPPTLYLFPHSFVFEELKSSWRPQHLNTFLHLCFRIAVLLAFVYVIVIVKFDHCHIRSHVSV